MDKIHIVAGNFNEFKNYVDRKKKEYWENPDSQKSIPNYRYVSSTESLKGLSEIQGFYIGTYKNRPDIKDIENSICAIKSKNSFSVTVNGVLVSSLDYNTSSFIVDNSNLQYFMVKFHQALPAGSVVSMTHKGVSQVIVSKVGDISFSFAFPL